MIDLAPEHLALVRRMLADHVPAAEVRVFGSRVTGAAKKHSDLDLALVADARLPLDVIGRLREAFEASVLPIRVDLVDWHAISDEFRGIISTHYERLDPSTP